MHDLIGFAGSVFMGFFAIMNPVANAPIFLGLTSDDDAKTSNLVARKATVLAFIIVAIFTVCGHLIFKLFGITFPAFQITGGLLVFVIGFQMLHGSSSKVHSPSEEDQKTSLEAKLSVAVSPIAVPILAGPGTIVTAMNFASGHSVEKLILTIVIFGVMCFITFLFFISGNKLTVYLGQGGINVITRLMGLILAVIGMQMLIGGIYGAVHAYS